MRNRLLCCLLYTSYPLLIKARSGGGGRGIRRVDGPEELEHAFLSATAEAESAFGDGAVYMEKLLENVKHVEVQVLCDAHGNVVTLSLIHIWGAPCGGSAPCRCPRSRRSCPASFRQRERSWPGR